ncbi:MAG: iron-only hydrogenase system regulator [Oscillospiraceae bacterium]|nr:iron-only hydrogenase system regulator [Oscillospiraceae bacterium]
MDECVALLGIVVEESDSVEQLNQLLHEFSQYILGRMGIPCQDRGLNLISVAVAAPADTVSTLSGRLGQIPGVTSKVIYAKK